MKKFMLRNMKTLLNNTIKKNIKTFQNLTIMKISIYQNFQDTDKIFHREKCIALYTHIRVAGN